MQTKFVNPNILKDRAVYIWGAGKHGIHTLAILNDCQVPISGFIDNDPAKWTKTIEGYCILSPEFLMKTFPGKKPYVFIGSMYEEEISASLKEMEYQYGVDFNNEIYSFLFGESIPGEWIKIQKYQPVISILMVINCLKEPKEYILEALHSVADQIYENYELCIIVFEKKPGEFSQIINGINLKNVNYMYCNDITEKEMFYKAFGLSKGKYITILDTKDLLSPNALAYVVEILNRNKDLKLLYTDEDYFEKSNEHFGRLYKRNLSLAEDGAEKYVLRGGYLKKDLVNYFGLSKEATKKILSSLELKYIKNINRVAYHVRVERTACNNDKMSERGY